MGLTESFDMAKRIGLIMFIVRTLSSEIYRSRDTFEIELIYKYQDMYSSLKNCLIEYRKQCNLSSNGFNQHIGLPKPTSKTSISKIARVAAAMQLVNMKVNKSLRIYQSNPLSFVLDSLCNYFNLSQSEFEYPLPIKGLLIKQLLNIDRDLTLALWISLRDIGKEKGLGMITRQMLESFCTYAEFLIELRLETGMIDRKSNVTLYKSLKYIQQNITLLSQKKPVRRGILHMLIPRLHWFIDLNIIDTGYHCKTGLIRVPQDINVQKELPKNINEFDNYIQLLFESSIIQVRNFEKKIKPDYNVLNMTDQTLDLTNTLVISIDMLRPYFPGLIPVDSIIKLAWGLLLKKTNISEEKLKNELLLSFDEATYRAMRGGNFIDPRKIH